MDMVDKHRSGNNQDALREVKTLFGGASLFDTPKPTKLISKILNLASKPDSLVLDFFSGSATTAEAAIRKNAADGGKCHFVLVQLPETDGIAEAAKQQGFQTLCDVAEERVRRAGARVLEDFAKAHPEGGVEPPDVGFRVFRVDSSNLRDVRRAPGEVDQGALFGDVDTLKESRSGLDLLFQVLPRFRIPLSARVEERDFAGLESFVVDGGKLVACFGGRVSTEAIEQVARLEPGYAVFRDSLLDGDSAAANPEELFRTFSPDTIRMTI